MSTTLDQKTEKYPFDFDALQKGDVLPPEMMQSIIKIPRNHRRYQLRLLALKVEIEHELESRGRPVNVRCEKDGLKILTDEESRPYTEQRFRQACRDLRKAHHRSLIIDRGNLTNEEQKRLDRDHLVQGMTISAVRKARHAALKCEANVRSTPALPDPSGVKRANDD